MEIATNAVLAAMLIQASQFVKSLDAPLELPLTRSNVVAFNVGVSWNQAQSDISPRQQILWVAPASRSLETSVFQPESVENGRSRCANHSEPVGADASATMVQSEKLITMRASAACAGLSQVSGRFLVKRCAILAHKFCHRADISCYLAYKGGYEFRLFHGFIGSFNTREAYSHIQNPEDLVLFVGEVRYDETACLERARHIIRNLGFDRVTLLNSAPQVTGPIIVREGTIPRFIFKWASIFNPKSADAEIEVNGSSLAIDALSFMNPAFWRESWPVTFGTTNTLADVLRASQSPNPKRTQLEVRDVSREYAAEYINAILPEISAFCAKLGPPFPAKVLLDDISMGESEVAVKLGRLSTSLRLKSGYLVVFFAGHVWAVHAPDAYYTSPWWREEVKWTPKFGQ